MRESFGRREELRERKEKKERFPGDNGGGVTPVSIPNTEVKSSCADGTAYSFRGRVGHCQDIGEEREEKFLFFFFCFLLNRINNRFYYNNIRLRYKDKLDDIPIPSCCQNC